MEYGIDWKGSCKSGGDYVVVELGIKKHGGNVYDVIRFTETKWKGIFTRNNIKLGKVKDRAMPSVHGIGRLGNCKTGTTTNNPIYNTWKGIMYRCSKKNSKVVDRWLCFSNFEEDFYNIPFSKNYMQSINNGEPKKWALDKDCMGEVIYGPQTTIYLPYQLNRAINEAPKILQGMGATLPSKQQIISYIEQNFECMIK